MASEGEVDEVARTRVYRKGRMEKENFPVADLSRYLKQEDTVVWVDLCAPDQEELQTVGDELGLHKLSIASAASARQRPKLDRFDTHDFLNMYDAYLDADAGEIKLSEVAAFITPKALITVRKERTFDMNDVVARWDDSSELATHGVGFLLHGLLDHVVDRHFEAVQSLDEEIENLEELLFDDRPHNVETQRRSFALRKSLVLLRRVVLPMREVVGTLLRRESEVISEEMVPYFQDVYDHVLRVTEWTESLRDLVSTILETNLTLQGNRLNVITKKVTGWAAIIAVPTAITGFYGQNIPYPGFSKQAGFISSTLLILVCTVGLYITFRKKNWL